MSTIVRSRLLLCLLCCLAYFGPVLAPAEQQADLIWDPNTEADLARYELWRGPGPCPDDTGRTRLPVDLGTSTSHRDQTIPDDWTSVCYWAKAIDKAENASAFSEPAGKSLPDVPKPAPPSFTFPALLATDVPPGDVTIVWTAVPGVDGYLLRVHEDGTPYDPCDQALVFCNDPSKLITETTQTVTLKPNTTYDIWIHSVLQGRIGSPQGNQFTTGTALDPPPTKPRGLRVTTATPEEVVVTASLADCPRVTVEGLSTTMEWTRTVRCLR